MKETLRKLKTLPASQDALLKSLFIVSVLLLISLLFLSVVRSSIFPTEESKDHVIFELVFLLLLAIVAESIVLYLKQPTVLILMLLGIAIGPSFLHLAWPLLFQYVPLLPQDPPEIFMNMHVVEIFAQLGAIILMFKVGLHSSISKIFTKENFLVALLGIIFPFAGGYLFAINTGGSFHYALFLGAALTATSVGVTVAILRELKLLEEKFSQVVLGAAIIDDVLSLLVLALVLNLPETFDPSAFQPFMWVLLYSIIFLVGGVFAGKHFVKMKIDRAGLNNKAFMYVLAFVFFYAYVAEFIGLSSIVGAFLAGMVLTYSKHAAEIDKLSNSVELMFTPIFFISLGMLVDVPSLWVFLVPILIISAIAVLTKLIGCGAAALLSGMNRNESLIIGFGMSPRGEVALIIAVFGLSAGVLTTSEYSIISAMAFLTAIILPPILKPLLEARRKAEKKGGVPA